MPTAGINLKLGMVLLIVAFAVSAPLLYGGALLVDEEDAAAEEQAGGGGTPGGPVTVTVVAQNIQFDRRTITATAGAQMTVTLDNRDAGVPHNIAFYTNRSASSPINVGELFPGPGTRVSTFNAPSTPGNYFFHCDAHPDTMTGTFTVN
jgi:plastocyanin